MVDPLSIAASIVTLIGATKVASEGLGRVASLRHAPQHVSDLKNEIDGLHRIVQAVHDLIIQRHNELAHSISIDVLRRALVKTESTLSTLDQLISNKLIVQDRDGEDKLGKCAWLRTATKIENLRKEIQSDKNELTFASSLLTL